MIDPRPIEARWKGEPCIVVGSGPSLTVPVVHKIRMARWLSGWNVIVVNDAYRLLPRADVLYASDFGWWVVHEGAKSFEGEKWSSHSHTSAFCDDKREFAGKYGLNLVQAFPGKDFSRSQNGISYGETAHSGFQAVNLALLFGASLVVLCGFDYGGSHFFGDHPETLRQPTDEQYLELARAFDTVTTDIEILNATPSSALKRFPMVDLDEALRRNDCLHRNGAIADAPPDRSCAA